MPNPDEIEGVLNYLLGPVLSAPVRFVVALIILGGLIYKLVKWYLKRDLSERDARIGTQGERIDLLKEKLEAVQAKSADLESTILELERALAAQPSNVETARELSLTASMIASDVGSYLRQAHLIASAGFGPVPFEGMEEGGVKSTRDDNSKQDSRESERGRLKSTRDDNL